MVLLAYAQAGFYSRDLMITEILRTVSFLLLAVFTSLFIAEHAIEYILVSLAISFFISSLLIAKRIGLKLKLSKSEFFSGKTKVYILQNFRYGWPLGVWFLIVYIMNYIEKPIIASIHGYASQGEYQVMFDLLSKGSGFVFTPVLFALFPILSNAIENNQHTEINNILKRIIRIELMILVISIIFYWLIGFHLISIVFKVPPLEKFKILGLILLISSIIWQISQVLHKPFELRKNTPAMLKGISIALVIYLITLLLVWLLVPHIIYAFAFPFLFACISYISFILYNLNEKKMMTIKA
jgi:O-antigen/teichoic acid export membrane protein